MEKAEKELSLAGNAGVSVGGISYGTTLIEIVNTLDTQVANGLGAGNGISAARLAIEKARKETKK